MSGSGRPKNTISPAWLTGEGAADGALSADSGSNGNGVSDSGVAHSSASHAASVKNETVQPKSEPFKPKFAPKVPVKKEPSVASAAASASETTSNQNKSDNKNGDKNRKANGNKSIRIDKFQPKGKSVGFSDSAHQGSRKWVMPVGAAFFTGTNSVGGGSSASSAGSSALKIGGVPVPISATAANPTGATRIARPNEQITGAPVNTTKIIKSVSNSSFVSYTSQAETDSDADDPDAQEDPEDATMMTNEIWPPLDYDPMAPLALPLGPKSLAMRNMLAAEPILADPLDEAALDKEQSSSLFVMQMPSDLHLEKVVERIDSNKDNGEGSRTKIGKMQLLRSGKVRLVTLDGRVYDVNSGMASSFVQILTSMEVPADPAKADGASAGLSAAGASASVGSAGASNATGSKASKTAPEPAAPKGVMSLMGSITKKLVITPSHDIGVRRRRRYSMSSGVPHCGGVPGESVFAAAAAGMSSNKQYPEDDEVIMMDS